VELGQGREPSGRRSQADVELTVSSSPYWGSPSCGCTWASIARTAGRSAQPPSATAVTFGHNVDTNEVDSVVMADAGRTDAQIVELAQDTFCGSYAGYFRIPTAASGRSPGTRR
jgi:hypothetical protein